MKLLAERDALVAALSAVNARACGKMTIPILECVLLDAADSRLRILSHWLDACCSFEIPAEVSEPGRIAIDADKLSGLVGGFAKGAQVSISATATEAEIKAGRSRYRLLALPPADFPEPLASQEAVQFSVPPGDFLSLLEAPEVAMCAELTRRYLNGIYLHSTKLGLASCATDGHNLVRVQTDLKAPPFTPIILPRERISDLRSGVDRDMVQIECCSRLFSVSVGPRRYTTKLIDGTFPEYERVIPALNGHQIVVTRIDLLNALQRLRVLLDERNTIIMRWGDGAPTVTLVPHRDETGADEVIESDGGEIPAGQFITAAVRLAGLMSAMPYDEVKITFTDDRSPLRIEGMKDGSVLQLIMPTDFGQATARAA